MALIMAEEFLGRLNQLEQKIDGLGETLKRMITILGSVTDLKSEITESKVKIIEAIQSQKPPEISIPEVSIPPGITQEEVKQIVQAELEPLTEVLVAMDIEQIKNMIQQFKDELLAAVQGITAVVPVTEALPDMPVEPASALPSDRAMLVADQLDLILKSLKMGCKAGDVIDAMASAKEEIMKVVPSDQIMVKIDRWMGVVGAYPKRNELKARDILKLKKELKGEIPKYRPA